MHWAVLFAVCALQAQVKPLPETGFRPMFDGKTLSGWDCDPAFWRATNGEIVGETAKAHQPEQNTFCIWKGGSPGDFELRLQYKLTGATGNSGIQYRGAILPPRPPAPAGPARGPAGPCPSGQPRGVPPSRESQAKWDMLGPQFDFDGRNNYTGQFYEQATGRGIIAWRGQVVHTEEGKAPRLVATLGEKEELGGYVKIDDWNQLHLIARGNTMTHIVNGHVMAVLIDDDASKFRKDGIIGFEIESFGKISLRNIWLKRL